MGKWIWLALLMAWGAALPCHSQQPASQAARNRLARALNRYVDFANESTHILWDLHLRLEALNQGANRVLAGSNTANLSFRIDDLFEGDLYLGAIQGICVVPPGSNHTQVHLRQLYEDTRVEDPYIPATYRELLHQYRDAYWFHMIELVAVCDTLARYVQSGRTGDPALGGVYRSLIKARLIFVLIGEQHAGLMQVVATATPTEPQALDDLKAIFTSSQAILRSLRQDDRTTMALHTTQLRAALDDATLSQTQRVPALAAMGFSADQVQAAYRDLSDYASQLYYASNRYLSNDYLLYAYQDYGGAYYFYNQRLLTLYNHYRYGMTAYYNRLLGFVRQPLVKQFDAMPWFEVLAPPSRPAGPQPPVSPQPAKPLVSLDDAPVNHLVFLLDVSASMKKPDKLPVLKEGIASLLDVMRPEDRISIVTYSGDATVIVESLSAVNREQILLELNRLNSYGETNLQQGLREAYRLAESHFLPGGNNRILLATDGAFDLKEPQRRMVGRMAEERGIRLSVLLLSKNEVPRTAEQLSELASLGGGTYFHVLAANVARTLLAEAQATFGD
ncbi:MAG: hypothetical protein OHK0039_00140 [Bacteroidia bacterium]